MTLRDLDHTIIGCQKCPRLIRYCQRVAKEKRRASYHPSQQNTFTGRLTEKMFHDLFKKARERGR